MSRSSWAPVVRSVEPDGISLWCSQGTGPAVVLVHGLEDTWDGWSPLVAALSQDYRVYALDMPWRAGSAHGWVHQGSPGQWLSRALDLVPEPIDALVGHSFGANSVLQLLAIPGAKPEATRAAALIAPFFRPRALEVSWDLHRQAIEAARLIMGQGLRLRLGSRGARLDPDALDAMTGVVMDRIGPLGIGAFFQLFVGTTDLPLSALDLPTLVLVGQHDVSLPGERARALAAAMPAAQVRRRPHYTHFCHVEQVNEVAAELETFLDHHLARQLAGVDA